MEDLLQELNDKQIRMIELSAEISNKDYWHIRQLREKTLGVEQTLSDSEYYEFCMRQQELLNEFHSLEIDVAELVQNEAQG